MINIQIWNLIAYTLDIIIYDALYGKYILSYILFNFKIVFFFACFVATFSLSFHLAIRRYTALCIIIHFFFMSSNKSNIIILHRKCMNV